MNVNDALQAALRHHQSGDLGQAEHIYREILQAYPADANALHLLGVVYSELGNYKDAAENIRKALQISPGFAEACNNLGNAQRNLGQFDEAIASYQKTIKLKPDFAEAYYNLGNVYRDKQQTAKSMTCYQKAIQLDPNIAEAHYSLGLAFRDRLQYEEAIRCFKRTLDIVPDSAEAYNSLGLVLSENGRFDEAILNYQKAIELIPSFAGAYYNLGNSLKEKEDLLGALNCYRKAVSFDPSYTYAHWNMSLILLLFGELGEGFKEYEWRWELKGIHKMRDFPQPVWDGSEVKGSTVLLHSEQGFGDAIQFIRYAPLVAKRGARVIVECQRELLSLLQGVEGVSRVVEQGKLLPEFDMHCPLLSLPLTFGTTASSIPADIPYIPVDPSLVKKWSAAINMDGVQFKIGLVWSGNPKNTNDRNRSLPLSIFSDIAGIRGVVLYSLQMGEAAEQADSMPEGLKLLDYTRDIHDFSDTAAFIENLDMVISVDTAVAHLAGALGKPVWTLLPTVPDWRWQLKRSDSPWYPTMRLFRQSVSGEWGDVILRITDELNRLIRG